MRLTAMTDFALRMLMYLGQHRERLCTIAEVANTYGISEAHLMKITHQLGAAGWIETLRGKGGGIRLAHPPGEIKLGTVVRSIESDLRLVECFATGSHCTLVGHCRLAGIMHEALDEFLGCLDGYTLADILLPSATRAGKSKAGARERTRGRVAVLSGANVMPGSTPQANAERRAVRRARVRAME